MSETLSIFPELDTAEARLKAAISADVEAAGGCKAIAPDIFPKLSVERAIQRLSNACNPKQAQELDKDQMFAVCRMARAAVGRSHIFAWYAAQLDCELHWITPQEKAVRVTTSLTVAMQGLSAVMGEANTLIRKLAEMQK